MTYFSDRPTMLMKTKNGLHGRIKVGHVCVYLTADEDKGGPCVCVPHC